MPRWTSQAAGARSPARIRLRLPAEADVEMAAAKEMVEYVLDRPGMPPGVPRPRATVPAPAKPPVPLPPSYAAASAAAPPPRLAPSPTPSRTATAPPPQPAPPAPASVQIAQGGHARSSSGLSELLYKTWFVPTFAGIIGVGIIGAGIIGVGIIGLLLAIAFN